MSIGDTAQLKLLFVIGDFDCQQRFECLLMPLEQTWCMTHVETAAEAYAALTTGVFDVIIADARLPEMNGDAFLQSVLERFTVPVHILLCTQAIPLLTAQAGSNGYHTLSRDCTEEQFRRKIEHALLLRRLLASESFRTLVAQVRALPGLPKLYLQMVRELNVPDVSLQRIGKIIEQDAGMSARVLKLVNSAAYGLAQPVISPALAVSLLGTQVVKSIVLLLDVFVQFDRIRTVLPEFSLEAFQEHCLTVCRYARKLAEGKQGDSALIELLMTASLLHDIGKLVLVMNFPEQYRAVLACTRERQVADWVTEQEIFGVTHADIGAYLLGLWGLPDDIVQTCAFHHRPRLCTADDQHALRLLHVANGFSHEALHPGAVSIEGILDEKYLEEQHVLHLLPNWRSLCFSG